MTSKVFSNIDFIVKLVLFELIIKSHFCPRNMQAQLKTEQAIAQPKFLIELAKPPQDKNCF